MMVRQLLLADLQDLAFECQRRFEIAGLAQRDRQTAARPPQVGMIGREGLGKRLRHPLLQRQCALRIPDRLHHVGEIAACHLQFGVALGQRCRQRVEDLALQFERAERVAQLQQRVGQIAASALQRRMVRPQGRRLLAENVLQQRAGATKVAGLPQERRQVVLRGQQERVARWQHLREHVHDLALELGRRVHLAEFRQRRGMSHPRALQRGVIGRQRSLAHGEHLAFEHERFLQASERRQSHRDAHLRHLHPGVLLRVLGREDGQHLLLQRERGLELPELHKRAGETAARHLQVVGVVGERGGEPIQDLLLELARATQVADRMHGVGDIIANHLHAEIAIGEGRLTVAQHRTQRRQRRRLVTESVRMLAQLQQHLLQRGKPLGRGALQLGELERAATCGTGLVQLAAAGGSLGLAQFAVHRLGDRRRVRGRLLPLRQQRTCGRNCAEPSPDRTCGEISRRRPELAHAPRTIATGAARVPSGGGRGGAPGRGAAAPKKWKWHCTSCTRPPSVSKRSTRMQEHCPASKVQPSVAGRSRPVTGTEGKEESRGTPWQHGVPSLFLRSIVPSSCEPRTRGTSPQRRSRADRDAGRQPAARPVRSLAATRRRSAATAT